MSRRASRTATYRSHRSGAASASRPLRSSSGRDARAASTTASATPVTAPDTPGGSSACRPSSQVRLLEQAFDLLLRVVLRFRLLFLHRLVHRFLHDRLARIGHLGPEVEVLELLARRPLLRLLLGGELARL